MQIPLSIDPSKSQTLQQQVYGQICEMILTEQLKMGGPVPGSRALAAQLGVSRNTVTIAYEMLLAEGYLEVRPNVGTFVAGNLPESGLRLERPMRHCCPGDATRHHPKGGSFLDRLVAGDFPVQQVRNSAAARLHTDFWIGRIDPRQFPVKDWRRIVDVKLRHGRAAISDYGDPGGIEQLRRAIADHLGPARGISCGAENVVVTAGSQDALMVLARAVGPTAGAFLHEDPGYSGAIHLFARSGLSCQPVPVDRDGLIVEALPEAPNAVLYLTPSHQFPTGVTLALPRRLALLEWAERTDSIILEDDYDGDFRHDGVPLTALRGIDRSGRVLYLGSFSKSLTPALRLGYIVATPTLAERLSLWKQLLSNGPPWHQQATLAEFMDSGGFLRHLRRIRTTYRRRRDSLIETIAELFPETEIFGRRGGVHISWRLPDGASARAVQKRALMRGIGLYTVEDGGACLAPGNDRHRDLLTLGYAAIEETRIRDAIGELPALMKGS